MPIPEEIKNRIIYLLLNSFRTNTSILNEVAPNQEITYEDFFNFMEEYQLEHGYVIRDYNNRIKKEQRALIDTYLTNENILKLYNEGYNLSRIVRYFKDLGIENETIIKNRCTFIISHEQSKNKSKIIASEDVQVLEKAENTKTQKVPLGKNCSEIPQKTKDEIIYLLLNTSRNYMSILKEADPNKEIEYQDLLDFLEEYQLEHGFIIRNYNNKISEEQRALIDRYLTNEVIKELYSQGYTLSRMLQYFKNLGIENEAVIKNRCDFIIKYEQSKDKPKVTITEDIENEIISLILTRKNYKEIQKVLMAKYNCNISENDIKGIINELKRHYDFKNNETYMKILDLVYQLAKEGYTEHHIMKTLLAEGYMCTNTSVTIYCLEAFKARGEQYEKKERFTHKEIDCIEELTPEIIQNIKELNISGMSQSRIYQYYEGRIQIGKIAEICQTIPDHIRNTNKYKKTRWTDEMDWVLVDMNLRGYTYGEMVKYIER